MLKRTAEIILARSGVAAIAARRRRGVTLILAYHNIVPDSAAPFGDRSLHLPLARFRAQLDALQRTHEFVDLAAIDDVATAAARPRVAVTFDDAYRSALALGLPELALRGLPATVFVAPGLLGRAGCWWDVLASTASGLAPDLRRHVLDALRGDDAGAIAWARANDRRIAPPTADAAIATEADLQSAALLPGVSYGAHTWTHCNLARAGDDVLERELRLPLSWLRERFRRVLPWLAYPYGLRGSATADHARDAGYERALSVDGGWVTPAIDTAFTLPRLNVSSGLTPDGFALRTCGLVS